MTRLLTIFSLLFGVYASAQNEYFRQYLRFDTLVTMQHDVEKTKGTYHIKLCEGKIYFVVCNEKTNEHFDFYVYHPIQLKLINHFTIHNANGSRGVIDFDVANETVAILSYSSWQIFKKSNSSFNLIAKKNYPHNENKNVFHNIHLINDSLIALARSYSFPTSNKSDASCVVQYDFLADKEVNRTQIDTRIPEFSIFSPNKRVYFYNNETYLGDFDELKIHKIGLNGKKTQLCLINHSKKI